MAGRKKKKKRFNSNFSLLLMAVVVLCVGVALMVRMDSMRQLNDTYELQEDNLRGQVDSESERAEGLKESQEYVKTDEYAQKIATEKLGLVKPGESVVKPKQ